MIATWFSDVFLKLQNGGGPPGTPGKTDFSKAANSGLFVVIFF